MGFFIGDSSDFRQRVYYSNKAWGVINRDKKEFNSCSESGILNRIFINYYEDAEASFTLRMKEEEEKYPPEVYSFIYSQKYKEFITKIKTYPKDFNKSFKVNKESCNILDNSEEDRVYANSIGTYLKAIFEEYSDLSRSKREQIFYKKNYMEAKSSISEDNPKKMNVTLLNGEKVNIRPFKIITDMNKIYTIIVGFEENSEELIGIMLNNINSFSLTKTKKYSFKKGEYSKCLEKIDKNEIKIIDCHVTKEEGGYVYNAEDDSIYHIQLVSM